MLLLIGDRKFVVVSYRTLEPVFHFTKVAEHPRIIGIKEVSGHGCRRHL